MPLTLEEIKKLPPKEIPAALKKFEDEQKRIKEEEKKKQEEIERKQKKEAEELLKKSIDEVAAIEEEEETNLKKESSKDKKDITLEDIAGTAKKETRGDAVEAVAYQTKQAYDASRAAQLAQQPSLSLYREAKELQDNRMIKGYLRPEEVQRADQLSEALYQKTKSEYAPDEKAKMFINRAEELLQDMRDPMKTKRYN